MVQIRYLFVARGFCIIGGRGMLNAHRPRGSEWDWKPIRLICVRLRSDSSLKQRPIINADPITD